MKRSALDALGSQFVSNEVAIISIPQALTRARPAIGKALIRAMRENSSRVPSGFHDGHTRIEQYVELVERLASAQTVSAPAVEMLRKGA